MTERLTLHWVSFLLHCAGFVLLLIAFSMPYWFTHDEGANEYENGGLWRRCRVGGGCVPLKDANEDLAIHMTPTQVLVTIAFVSAAVSLIFFSLWLWKGEMCDTPWKKRCHWCAETYVRSRTPKTQETTKYRRMKWGAFGFSFLSGTLNLTGTIVFMVNTLLKNEGQPDQLGWCTWISLTSAILMLSTSLVIGLCSYLLKYPDSSDIEDDNIEAKFNEYSLADAKEMERIQAWILEQKNGLDNPSFTRDWDYPRHNSIYSTRSIKSNQSKCSGVYYIGQNDPAYLDQSRNSLSSAYSRDNYVARYPKRIAPGASANLYSPMYSVIFKGKVPMIPKKPMTPETAFIYDTIYGFSKGTLPPVLSDYYGNSVKPSTVKERIRRPSSHLGITSHYDDITKMRNGNGIYDRRGRPVSDSNLYNRHDPDDRGARRPRSTSANTSRDHQKFSSLESMGPFEPGILPGAYRYRKHPERRSTSSLATNNSSQDHNSSFGYRVRTKFPEESDEDLELPLSYVLSHGMQSLDLSGANKYELDNIWVVPSKDEIPEVLGKNRVHFKLEKSIQELDEFDIEMEQLEEFDETESESEEDV